jgi:hypothetical protein
MKLRFLKSQGYNGQIVRSGSVIEVSDFWARKFVQDGVAIPETLTQDVEVKAEQPQRRGRKRNGKS